MSFTEMLKQLKEHSHVETNRRFTAEDEERWVYVHLPGQAWMEVAARNTGC